MSYIYGPEYRTGNFKSRADRAAALAIVRAGKPASWTLSHPYGSAQYVRRDGAIVLQISSDNGRVYSSRRVG